MTIVIAKEIREVGNGYILKLRWPYGGDAGAYGEVVCKTWVEVLQRLTEAAGKEPCQIIVSHPDDSFNTQTRG